jgi:uncharacterized protein involved in exopolysaccharide biosynthesis
MKMDEPNLKKPIIEVDNGFSLRDALNVIFCHKWKIILFFLAVTSSVSTVTYRLPYYYESQAKLLIGVGPDSASIAPKILGPSQYLNQGQIERVNNEVTVLTSRYLAELVVDDIGLNTFFNRFSWKENSSGKTAPFLGEHELEDWEVDSLTESAVNQLVYGLVVEVKPKSFILNLTLSNQDPELVHIALDAIIKGYLKRKIQLRRPKKSVSVFEKRFQRYKKDLEEKEQALADFREKNQILSMLTQKQLLITQISHEQQRLNSTTNEIETLSTKINKLNEQLPNFKERIELQRVKGRTNYVADTLKNLLYKLEAEETELASRYLDDSRQVIDVREQISRLRSHLKTEDHIKTEVTIGLNQNYQRMIFDLANTKIKHAGQISRQASMYKELQRLKYNLSKLARLELKLQRLERHVELANKDFRADREVLERANSYEALNENGVVNVEIIEPPTETDYGNHVRPNKPRNIILGIVLGLLGGLGLAFVLDYFNDSMKNSEDVKRRLKLPVLSIISASSFQKCVEKNNE